MLINNIIKEYFKIKLSSSHLPVIIRLSCTKYRISNLYYGLYGDMEKCEQYLWYGHKILDNLTVSNRY